MKLKFLAVTMPKYSGADAKGQVVELSEGDSCEFSPSSAAVLLRKYTRDFAKVEDAAPKAEFTADSDKQYKKQSNFKGK